MTQAEIIGYVVIGLGALIGLSVPVLKLNSNITRLITTIEHINSTDKRQDERLDAHSERLDGVETGLNKHDNRLTLLEDWKSSQKEKEKLHGTN